MLTEKDIVGLGVASEPLVIETSREVVPKVFTI